MLDSAPGARDRIDAFGWHPYAGEVAQIIGSVAAARAVLKQRGLAGAPIEISESARLTRAAVFARAAL